MRRPKAPWSRGRDARRYAAYANATLGQPYEHYFVRTLAEWLDYFRNNDSGPRDETLTSPPAPLRPSQTVSEETSKPGCPSSHRAPKRVKDEGCASRPALDTAPPLSSTHIDHTCSGRQRGRPPACRAAWLRNA